jgi:hypothetical protein
VGNGRPLDGVVEDDCILERTSDESPPGDPGTRRDNQRRTASRAAEPHHGGPGSRKTVYALQSLGNGAYGEKQAGVFVAFEEGTRQIVANAATIGWDLPGLEKKKLLFLDARLTPKTVKAPEFDLLGMLSRVLVDGHEDGSENLSGSKVRD